MIETAVLRDAIRVNVLCGARLADQGIAISIESEVEGIPHRGLADALIVGNRYGQDH